MANEQNLKPPFNELTPSEHREIASKGGTASSKKRREKKAMREALQMMMAAPVKSEKNKAKIKEAFGLGNKDIDQQIALLYAQFTAALKGNTQAAIFIRDTMGEAPVKELQVEQIIPQPLAPIKDED